MDSSEADLAEESTFELQYSPDNDGTFQSAVSALQGSACTDDLNYNLSLSSTTPKVKRRKTKIILLMVIKQLCT